MKVDITGSQREVGAAMLKLKKGEEWTAAIAKVRNAREAAISAALAAARKSGLPSRGSAFKALLENGNLNKKPDQVLAAINYLRSVEGVTDSPPRVIQDLFEDAEVEPPGNLSLYLNRLRERGFLSSPAGAVDKNRYVQVTPEGLTHLDKRTTIEY